MRKLGMLAVCAATAIVACAAQRIDRGLQELYMPTRLEWLEVECNATYQKRNTPDQQVMFLSKAPNQMWICLGLKKTMNVVDRQKRVDELKEFVKGNVDRRKWPAVEIVLVDSPIENL